MSEIDYAALGFPALIAKAKEADELRALLAKADKALAISTGDTFAELRARIAAVQKE